MTMTQQIEGHAGQQAIAAMMAFGTDVMFTLNGGHIWPLYEAARDQGMRVVDTRHEQTATFAAEGWAKLTRRPGLAALTAGPGITNGVSAITTAHFNGSPLVVMGGRAPELRWGSGSLQEMDHVPVVSSITKSAATVKDAAQAGGDGACRGEPGDDTAPRADVPRLPARRVRPVGRRAAGGRRGRRPGQPLRTRRQSRTCRADRRRPSGRRSSSAATSTGTARGTSCAPRSSTCACRASSTASGAARCRPITSWRSCARAGC